MEKMLLLLFQFHSGKIRALICCQHDIWSDRLFCFVYQIVGTKTAFVFKLSKLISYLLGGA